MLMLMLSSMIDYSSAMEDALLTKLNMIMFFFFVLLLLLIFLNLQNLPRSTYNMLD